MMIAFYTILSVIAVSLVALVAMIPFLRAKKVPKSILLALLSVSIGTLLGGVFIHFIPEAMHDGYSLSIALWIIGGFLVFFLIEKFVHYHHHAKHHEAMAHGHAYQLAPLNIIGDAIHNFLDGLVIAGSYIASPALGLAATISVIFHELPQEIADFGVLLYAGMSKKKALLFNLMAAGTAIIGAIVGLVLSGMAEGFAEGIIPFAAGSFIYIAASNLVPELHRHYKLKDTVLNLIMIIVGVALMAAITLWLPDIH